MRVFFDGVPERQEKTIPSVKAAKGNSPEVKKTEAASPQAFPLVFSHAPYSEKQCDSCHDTKYSQRLTKQVKELCSSCHEDSSKGKKVVHFPVSEGACTDCHDPHQAENKFILKKSIPLICFNCHEEKDIKKNPAHEGQSNCLECHNAHASNSEKLLK